MEANDLDLLVSTVLGGEQARHMHLLNAYAALLRELARLRARVKALEDGALDAPDAPAEAPG